MHPLFKCAPGLVLLISTAAVSAAERQLPDFSRLVEINGPGVVNISTTQIARRSPAPPADMPGSSEGAPFDAFASANMDFADAAARSGACDASTRVAYARGRLVLHCPNGVPKGGLTGLEDARFRVVAIATPEHAPYGKAAREALQKRQAWADAHGDREARSSRPGTRASRR